VNAMKEKRTELGRLKHKASGIKKAPVRIEETLVPKSEDLDFLDQKLNEEFVGKREVRSFGFFIRNGDGEIIAGCAGRMGFKSIYTGQLWVHPSYRKQNLGRKLMDKMHELGRKFGCYFATVGALDFQGSRGFYEKLGYVVEYKGEGYVDNSTCFFLKKTL